MQPGPARCPRSSREPRVCRALEVTTHTCSGLWNHQHHRYGFKRSYPDTPMCPWTFTSPVQPPEALGSHMWPVAYFDWTALRTCHCQPSVPLPCQTLSWGSNQSPRNEHPLSAEDRLHHKQLSLLCLKGIIFLPRFLTQKEILFGFCLCVSREGLAVFPRLALNL